MHNKRINADTQLEVKHTVSVEYNFGYTNIVEQDV